MFIYELIWCDRLYTLFKFYVINIPQYHSSTFVIYACTWDSVAWGVWGVSIFVYTSLFAPYEWVTTFCSATYYLREALWSLFTSLGVWMA
jgi:hypothetical protein